MPSHAKTVDIVTVDKSGDKAKALIGTLAKVDYLL